MDRSASTIAVAHVDAEETASDAVERELVREDERFEVVHAGDSAAVLDRLAEFDCVLSTHAADGIDGLAFLRAVRARAPDLPFVLYTDEGSEALASDAIAADVTDYVPTDGTDPEEVATAVVSAVGSRGRASPPTGTESLLAELVDNTNDVLWVFERGWEELLFVNPAYEEIYGRPAEELRSDPTSFLSAVHPDDREDVRASMAALDRGEEVELEYRVDEAEDYERWVWVQAEPIVEDGEVVRHVGFTRDVTRRKERERELRRQERRFQAVFDDPNILVGLLEPDGTVLDVNRTAMEYVDLDVDAIRGTRFWDAPWWDDDEATRREVRVSIQRAAGGEYVEYETTHHRDNGTPYSVEGVYRPVTTADGEVEAIVVSARDVTERMRREELIEVLNRVLRHNLRNDMNTIHGYAEQLAGRLAESSEAGEYVRTIRERADSLIELSETASDLEASLRRTGSTSYVHLGDAVDGAVATVRARYPDAEVDVEIAHRLDVRVSETLREALTEVLDNAVKHSGDRAASVAVEPGTDDRVILAVSDDGPGLPDQERCVLETGRETQLQHGSGLGLWLVYWVVTGCGGTVSVPESGGGTTVHLEVPFRE